MWSVDRLLSADRGVQTSIDGKLKAMHVALDALRGEDIPECFDKAAGEICHRGRNV